MAGHVVAVVLLGALAVGYARHVLEVFGSRTIDDAAISYAYADSLAHGRGLRVTANEAPSEGFSNFLEVLALAPFARFTDLDPVSKRLNVGCCAAGLCLLSLLVYRRLRGPWRLLAPVPLLLAFTWSGFNYWTAAGLEGGLLAGLQMASVVALVGAPSRGADLTLGIVAGLLAWVRPEAAAYGGIAVLARLAVAAPGEGWRSLARWRAPLLFGGLCLVLFVTRLALFRDIVPNTYWAKVGNQTSREAGKEYLLQFVANRSWYFMCGLPLLALAAREVRPAVLAALGQLAFALYFPIHVGGDWMREFRLVQPAMGPLAALMALGLLSPVTAPGARLPASARALTVAGLLFAPLLWATVRPGWRNVEQRVTAFRDIDMRILTEVGGYYRRFGERLELGRPLLHVDVDAGGISYRGGMDVIDMSGLTDRVMARGWTRESGLIVDYLFGERRPDTIHLHGSWTAGTPVHALSPFGLDYRAFDQRGVGELHVSPITAARADLLDPPVVPALALEATVGGAALLGVSAVPVGGEVLLFAHARQAERGSAAPLVWTATGGRRFEAPWHAGASVAPGPVGSTLLAQIRVPAGALPLAVAGTAIKLERWPTFRADPTTLEGLTRAALLRRARAPRPPCDPGPLLDPRADGPSRARGVAVIAELCGGLPDGARRRYADLAWAAARDAATADDRYEAAVSAFRLRLPQTVGQRLFVERARRDHQRHDEILIAWAERDLGAVPTPAPALGRGLALLHAARQDGDLLLRALAAGWLGVAEARGPLCGAVRRLGLRPDAVAHGFSCQGASPPAVTVLRQGFEDAADGTLQLTGAAPRWLATAGRPGQLAAGGQGRWFLNTRGQTPQETLGGEVVWGPFSLPGTRFGALLAGEPVLVLEIEDKGRWTEIWRAPRPPFPSPMTPVIAEVPDHRGRRARIRLRKGSGDFLADALTFVDVGR